MAPPIAGDEMLGVAPTLPPMMPASVGRQPWFKGGPGTGFVGTGRPDGDLGADGPFTNCEDVVPYDGRQGPSPYSNSHKLPRFRLSHFSRHVSTKAGKPRHSAKLPVANWFAKSSGQINRSNHCRSRREDSEFYHQLPAAPHKAGTLSDWQRSFMEGPRANHLFPEDDFLSGGSKALSPRTPMRPRRASNPDILTDEATIEDSTMMATDLPTLDFSSSLYTAFPHHAMPSARDWIWGGKANSRGIPLSQQAKASVMKTTALPDINSPRPDSSAVKAQTAAMFAEQYTKAAQEAADMAERYRDPVTKSNDDQQDSRRKQEAKKTKGKDEMQESEIADTPPVAKHRERKKHAAGEAEMTDNVSAEHSYQSNQSDVSKVSAKAPGERSPKAAAKAAGEGSPSVASKAPAEGTPRSVQKAVHTAAPDHPAQTPNTGRNRVQTEDTPAKPAKPVQRKSRHAMTVSVEKHDHVTAPSTAPTPRSQRPFEKRKTSGPVLQPTQRSNTKGSGDREGNASKESTEPPCSSRRSSSKRYSLNEGRNALNLSRRASGHSEEEGDEAGLSGTMLRTPTSSSANFESLKAGSSLLGSRKRFDHLHDNVDFNEVVNVAKAHNLQVDEVHERMKEFVQYDKAGTGFLSLDEFEGVVRKICHVDKDGKLPDHLLHSHWQQVDADGDNQVSFEEYVLWSLETAYSEEVLVPDAGQRLLRHLAREHGFAICDVERVKDVFDEFDADGSGQIDTEEFFQVIMKLMKVKNPSDISKKRLQRYWAEVDTDRSGEISFEEFLLWYTRNGT